MHMCARKRPKSSRNFDTRGIGTRALIRGASVRSQNPAFRNGSTRSASHAPPSCLRASAWHSAYAALPRAASLFIESHRTKSPGQTSTEYSSYVAQRSSTRVSATRLPLF
eukprot:159760-Pleurochrysis_carterae.AAC.3